MEGYCRAGTCGGAGIGMPAQARAIFRLAGANGSRNRVGSQQPAVLLPAIELDEKENMWSDSKMLLALCACFTALFLPVRVKAQTGSIHEPVRYVGGEIVHHESHDGQLRPVVGIESFQVMRANRSHPELNDEFGWTYNHAPMIVYWNGRYYVEYLSNPVGEHIAPGQTFLCSSTNGRDWNLPRVVFPIYNLQPPDPPGTAMMHQRMGFYLLGRTLARSCLYGHARSVQEGASAFARSTKMARSDRSTSSATTRRRAGRKKHRLSFTAARPTRALSPLRRNARQSIDARTMVDEELDDDFFSVRRSARRKR